MNLFFRSIQVASKTQRKLIAVIVILLFLESCNSPKKLINEEVILKNSNSVTGTIKSCDTVGIKLLKMDESQINISWTEIDTIVGKRYRTFWAGFNTGYYNTPYFSTFRNEAMAGRSLGFQFKIGKAVRGKIMNYFTYTFVPAQPYHINKFGVGFQRYIKKATYLSDKGFFWGLEADLMNAKYNNGVQFTLDPFGGYDYKINDQLRIHGKFSLQINFANKNNDLGANLTIGIHFLKRNFKTYYASLNQQHRLLKN